MDQNGNQLSSLDSADVNKIIGRLRDNADRFDSDRENEKDHSIFLSADKKGNDKNESILVNNKTPDSFVISNYKLGPYSKEEDEIIRLEVSNDFDKTVDIWSKLEKKLRRNSKSLQKRWESLNHNNKLKIRSPQTPIDVMYSDLTNRNDVEVSSLCSSTIDKVILSPRIRINYTEEEDQKILRFVEDWENKGNGKGLWSRLAEVLGRRNPSTVKQRYSIIQTKKAKNVSTTPGANKEKQNKNFQNNFDNKSFNQEEVISSSRTLITNQSISTKIEDMKHALKLKSDAFTSDDDDMIRTSVETWVYRYSLWSYLGNKLNRDSISIAYRWNELLKFSAVSRKDLFDEERIVTHGLLIDMVERISYNYQIRSNVTVEEGNKKITLNETEHRNQMIDMTNTQMIDMANKQSDRTDDVENHYYICSNIGSYSTNPKFSRSWNLQEVFFFFNYDLYFIYSQEDTLKKLIVN